MTNSNEGAALGKVARKGFLRQKYLSCKLSDKEAMM